MMQKVFSILSFRQADMLYLTISKNKEPQNKPELLNKHPKTRMPNLRPLKCPSLYPLSPPPPPPPHGDSTSHFLHPRADNKPYSMALE